ncbi:MAG: response regulator, partial [Bacteroidota bacterium]|nr:response regulator [Bacteroidota bacterium]MDX5431164.1 response regulator [Bacteroidota bacterium]MDX5469906.1 response regulator [Bacteroidota bacterium]
KAAYKDMIVAGNQMLELINEILQDGSTLEKWELKNDFEAEDQDHSLLKGKRFLLLEDNGLNQKLMLSLLKHYEVELDIASDGQIGLDLCKKNDYDLILCDLQMPNIDGYEFIQAFRSELGKQTPVIALSAQVFDQERKNALAAGMNGCVGKPFKKEELLLSVRTVLQNDTSTPNFEPLEQLTMGDYTFMREMLENYLETMDQYLKDFAAIEEESQRTELKRLAHKLRSTAQIVSIAKIDEQLRLFEEDEKSTWDQLQQLKREICHGYYTAFPAIKDKLGQLKTE